MSHKTKVNVKIDNKQALKESLEEMGYQIKEGKHTLSDFGWKMDCDISILKNKKQLNIGFRKEKDHYEMEADWYRTGINPKEFEQQINQLHGKHKVKNWLLKNRYNIEYSEEEDGSLVLTGTKWN